MEINGIKEKLKILLKNKLLLGSLIFYLLIPFLLLFIAKVNVRSRTAGVYSYYENGQLSSQIILGKKNTAEIHFYSGDYKNDKEYQYFRSIDRWSYRESAWMDNYDPEKFKYLSLEYIRLGGPTYECYFILFKIGDKLYSDFLIDQSRGGGQKCYIKN